jgi:hypothetical protein
VGYGGFGELAGSIRCVGTTRFSIDEMTPWTQNVVVLMQSYMYNIFFY